MTYNLYFASLEDAAEPALSASKTLHETKFREVLQRLLDDPTFLPEGGSIGFGLRYQYPVEKRKEQNPLLPYKSLSVAQQCLKGSDAVIMAVARELTLAASLRVLYQPDEREHAFRSRPEPLVMKGNFEQLWSWPVRRPAPVSPPRHR